MKIKGSFCSICLLVLFASKLDIELIIILCFFKGIILEYVQGGEVKTKSIDLLDLSAAWVLSLCIDWYCLLVQNNLYN